MESCLLYLLTAAVCLVDANRVKIPVELKGNSDDDHVLLTIADGQIRGSKNETVGQNKEYYAFRGIPFAKPPIGDLRFRAPEENEKWDGILDATQDKSECVQNIDPVTGSEDCLYINVYTPSLTNKNMAVMVWIHGGGFLVGNSSYETSGPDYLLDEDVIYVSFNYRLGVFGFISTEDLACPGNWGLKDQVLALKWVQHNIRYFGGDPANVTIFGQSSGSASVSYLLQTKQTKDLFKAAIMESGSSMCLWALNRRARDIAFEIGEKLSLTTENSTVLVDHLRNVSFSDLQDVATIVSTTKTLENPLASIMFSPVKEPYHDGAVFYNDSDVLMSQGEFHRVPTLSGFNSNEAAVDDDIPALIRIFLLKYDAIPTQLVPVDLTDIKENIVAVEGPIKEYYFGVEPVALETDPVFKFLSDDMFNRPIRQMVRHSSKYAPTYLYMFSYKGVLGGHANQSSKGVSHAEELGYIFRTHLQSSTSRGDIQIRRRMVKLWTNFAKYNNPTPTKDHLFQCVTWLPVNATQSEITYFDINSDMKLLKDPFKKEMAFWDRIYKEYGNPPYDTY